jgi:hypothetical protein
LSAAAILNETYEKSDAIGPHIRSGKRPESKMLSPNKTKLSNQPPFFQNGKGRILSSPKSRSPKSLKMTPRTPKIKVSHEMFTAHQILGSGSFGQVFLVERKSD